MNLLKLELSQKLNMTHQLVQSVAILAMSGQDLNDFIDKSVLENPILEASDKTPLSAIEEKWLPKSTQSENPNDALYALAEQTQSIQDNLLFQAKLTIKDKLDMIIAEYIIGSLNESGYLEQSTIKIAKKLNTTNQQVERVRQIILELDPVGFACLNVQEFLLLQLAQKAENDLTRLAILIIKEHLVALSEHDFQSISTETKTTIAQVQKAVDLIRHLNPRPINSFISNKQLSYIVPDILIKKEQDKYIVILNPMYTRNLYIHDEYTALSKNVDKETKKYINKNLRSAKWIIKCLEQREKTIRKISELIVNLQHDFLEFGSLYMHPLTLKDIAKLANLHESTVSRTIHNKYAQTPHGTISMKEFFPTGISVLNGDKISTDQIKNYIVEILKNHTKISDQKISEILAQRGIKVARRTVTKYRNLIGLNTSFSKSRKRMPKS